MEPTKIVYDICRHYLKDQHEVDPDLVKRVGGYHRSRNLSELASCSRHFDPVYHGVKDWRFLRQVEAFFKKNSAFSNMEVTSAAAQATFTEAEERCAETNLRLEFFYFQRDLLDPDLESRVQVMERYIRNVLGDFQYFLDDIPSLVRVTPGATSSSARKHSLPQIKMRMKLFATQGAAPYLRALYRFYGFEAPRIVPVRSNRVELVPKNWKTDRTIACEPEGNLPLQLAFDTYAKRRLRRFGIDLRCQSANQERALESSVTDEYVTVDFSAASDTLSYNAVAWLLPGEWLKFLEDVRSPFYRGAFGEGKYQKFSSMGNGCTFTLETLIFAAACYASGSRNFLVYGDDVIIEKEFYETYIRLTRFLGFTINREKSFSDGPFRESCGLDAFEGVDVTPVYIREVDRRKSVMSHLVNTMLELCFPGSSLAGYLYSLTVQLNLPLVPYQENTTSGVWISPAVARRLGILRRMFYGKRVWRLRYEGEKFSKHPLVRQHNLRDSGCETFKALMPKHERRMFRRHRGYYLWFLSRSAKVLYAGPWVLARSTDATETSSVPIFLHKYVRKWVSWIEPAEAVPDHLHWWSDLFSAPKKARR